MADKLIVVAGPTAGGKSDLALALARAFDGEIVNADSMQVYRALRIMTARPGKDDEAAVPHHLYGVVAATEPCSAARWRAMATAVLGDIWGRGRVAVLVGGSGLYFRALFDGLAPVPDIPAAVRAAGAAELAARGAPAMHAEMARLDPVGAARIAVNDRQRILRAWEVATATGRPLSDWRRQPHSGGLDSLGRNLAIARMVIEPPRQGLYERIDARLEQMLADGGQAELEDLLARRLDPGLPVMKALGVPQMLAWLRGEVPRDRAVAAAQTATRHYAKRQLTWFRNQFGDWERPNTQFSEININEIFSFVREKILTA